MTVHPFLDLDITLRDNKFALKLFDKRDAFPFTIVRMPYKASNIPSRIFFASVGAEILRIAGTTSDVESFLMSSSILLKRMLNQGGKQEILCKTLKKMYGRHEVFHQFSDNSNNFVKLLFK